MIASFTVVLTAYWLYALVVVPWIEPEVEIQAAGPQVDLFPEPADERQALETLFGSGAWELDQPKVIENGQSKLLFKDYTRQSPNTVELRPCTLIFLPEDDLPILDRYQRAMVMEVPEGAVLEFDQPLDLTQGKMGRLVRGQLRGPVRIRSQGRSPGPEDDLRISTREVSLTQQEITTPEKVEFSWGPHFGRGQDLRIQLAPGGKAASGLSLGGLQSLEVRRVEVVHLQVPADSTHSLAGRALVSQTSKAPSDATGVKPPASQAESTGAAEITCRGPLRFDAKKLETSFTDQVQVRHTPPEGPTDLLRCDQLVVAFRAQPTPGKSHSTSDKKSPTQPNPKAKDADPPKPPPTEQAKKASASPSRLEPQRLEAIGRPAVLDAPSRQSRAVAERLEYHLTTGRTLLEGGQEVWICHGPHEIHAQKLEYTPGPAGKLGQGVAEGAGWLRAETDPRTGQTVQARWTQALQLRPHQGQQVLSLLGQAEVIYSGLGRLAAEQIHLWIQQRSLPDQPLGREALAPDRLLAEGQVQLQHPQVTALSDRLEVWFDATTAAGKTPVFQPIGASDRKEMERFGAILIARTSQAIALSEQPWWQALTEASPDSSASSPAPSRSGRPTSWSEDLASPGWSNPARSPASGAPEMPSVDPRQPVEAVQPSTPQHFEVRAKLLRAQILLSGRQSELAELILEGDVFLTETQTNQPGQKPLVVTGDQIHVVDASRPYLALSVQGQPAHVEARGLGLNGAKINLHRGTNRLWIDGPGWMSMPADRHLDGRPSGQNDQVDVHWQQRMQFDGRSIRFEDSVLASSRCWQLRTDSLEVQLREPVVFTAPRAPANTQLHRLICRSEVLLENRSWDAQGELSRDRVETADLTVDLITGDLTATGPGNFRSMRRTEKKNPVAQGVLGQSSTGKQPADIPRPGDSPTGLTFLSVEFQRSLVGNLHRREMTFADRVRTIYGPVQTWEENIPWRAQGALPPQVVFLSCDQLSAAEMAIPPAGERFLELLAVGNTVIESAGYTARAHRLSYTENKGLVVLEGDGRTDAELFSQDRLGAPRQRVAARKIYYWPATNHLSLDSASLLEVQQPERKR